MARHFVVSLLLWLLGTGAALSAQTQVAEHRPDPLLVGVKEAPPFVIRHADGRWSGISIDLWRAVAEDLGLDYRIQAFDLQDLLDAVERHEVDVAVGALSITEAREEVVDFTHTYYVSSLGIAVPAAPGTGGFGALSPFFSSHFFKLIGGLALVLVVFGALLWWFERRRNADQFGGGGLSGVGSGVWWAAVTMTTVGYGDKYPKTSGGRAVALVWMFASLFLVSLFTGAIASVLTVSGLSSVVAGPEDLPQVRVASVADAASSDWLEEKYIGFVSYPDVDAALKALRTGAAEAAVYDRPILSYLARQNPQSNIAVLPRKFAFNHYGFALPTRSPLLESINRAILAHIQRPEWHDIVYRYTGDEF